MRRVRVSLVFEFLLCWGISLNRFLSARNNKKNSLRRVCWTEGVGVGISNVASSPLGHRKNGQPQRQALWDKKLFGQRQLGLSWIGRGQLKRVWEQARVGGGCGSQMSVKRHPTLRFPISLNTPEGLFSNSISVQALPVGTKFLSFH